MEAEILVVDDSAAIRKILQRVLRQTGMAIGTIMEAGDGEEALAVLKTHKVHLVLTDINMPKMDGLTATRAIRAAERGTGKHVPIVAMTANAFAEDREACFAAGMDDYLAKPVRLNNLRAVLERWAPITPAT